MKNFLLVLFVALVSVSCSAQKLQTDITLPPQTLYFGGDILTMDGNKPSYVEAVMVRDGKIISSGTKSNVLNNYEGKTEEVDLKGKAMMPGFIEPHVHPSIAAILLGGDIVAPHDWDVPDGLKKGVEGHEAYLARLKESLGKYGKEDSVLFIWGYHQLWHGDLNRDILNKVSPTKPVAIIHRSFHEVFLNDAAIKLMGVKEEDYKDNPQVEWKRGHFFEGGLVGTCASHRTLSSKPFSLQKRA